MRADGAVATPNSFSETFRYFIRRTRIKVCRFHDLRHTHATELLRLGVPLKTVAVRLGHADPALTMRVYAHATPDQDREAAAAARRSVSNPIAGRTSIDRKSATFRPPLDDRGDHARKPPKSGVAAIITPS
jgi:hypothetical protein